MHLSPLPPWEKMGQILPLDVGTELSLRSGRGWLHMCH